MLHIQCDQPLAAKWKPRNKRKNSKFSVEVSFTSKQQLFVFQKHSQTSTPCVHLRALRKHTRRNMLSSAWGLAHTMIHWHPHMNQCCKQWFTHKRTKKNSLLRFLWSNFAKKIKSKSTQYASSETKSRSQHCFQWRQAHAKSTSPMRLNKETFISWIEQSVYGDRNLQRSCRHK